MAFSCPRSSSVVELDAGSPRQLLRLQPVALDVEAELFAFWWVYFVKIADDLRMDQSIRHLLKKIIKRLRRGYRDEWAVGASSVRQTRTRSAWERVGVSQMVACLEAFQEPAARSSRPRTPATRIPDQLLRMYGSLVLEQLSHVEAGV